MVTLAEIESVDREGTRRQAVSRTSPRTRRDFIRQSAAVLTGAGLALVAYIPTARPARAEHGGQHKEDFTGTDWYGSCPTAISGTCSPACGPSTVYSDVCDGIYHKSTGNYRARPNECKSGTYDGWYWATIHQCGICNCGYCANFRCHDGCKWINSAWKNSICRTSYCVSGACTC